MLNTSACATLLIFARTLESGQSISHNRRRDCTFTVAKEEATDSIRKEQPSLQEIGYRSPLQYDARRAAVRVSKDRHATDLADS